MTAETSQTLDRGLRILSLLADAPDGLTVPELTGALKVNRTVVYRMLATLEAHDLVRRTTGGRTRLGIGALTLARRAHPLVREAALPCLRRLAEETGATAHLTIVDADEALVVAVAEPTWTDYHVAYRVGSRHTLDECAAGQALLAARRAREGLECVGPGCARTTRSGRPCATPYIGVPGDGFRTAPGIASAILALSAVEAAVGIVSFHEFTAEEADRIGLRVAETALEVGDVLAGPAVACATA